MSDGNHVILAQIVATPQGFGIQLSPAVDDPVLFAQQVIAGFAELAARERVKEQQGKPKIAVPQMVLRP